MAQVVRLGRPQDDERVRARSSERRAGGRSTRSRRSRSGTTGHAAASTRPPRPCSSPTPTPASSPRRMTAELRAERLLDGGWHTAYLCAPAHEQRRLQPLFATLVQEIVAHAYDRATETGKPLDPPLLLVLDECANIAPLRDLATLASTGAGQGIQLVSVFQDMAQINAVYGRDRAPTIVSNHRAKVILSGIADPQTLDYVARLLGDEEVRQISSTSGAEGRRSTTESVALPQPRAGERPPRDAARARASSSTATSPRRGSRSGPGSRTGGSVDSRGAPLAVRRPRYRERHPRRPDHAPAEAAREAPRGARARRAPVPLRRPSSTGTRTTASRSRCTSTRADGATSSTSRASSRTTAVSAPPAAGRSLPEPAAPLLAAAAPRRLRASRRMFVHRRIRCHQPHRGRASRHPPAPPCGSPARLRLRRPARARPSRGLDRSARRPRLRPRCARGDAPLILRINPSSRQPHPDPDTMRPHRRRHVRYRRSLVRSGYAIRLG